MSEGGGDAGMSTVESVVLEGGTTSVSWPSQPSQTAQEPPVPASSSSDSDKESHITGHRVDDSEI